MSKSKKRTNKDEKEKRKQKYKDVKVHVLYSSFRVSIIYFLRKVPEFYVITRTQKTSKKRE